MEARAVAHLVLGTLLLVNPVASADEGAADERLVEIRQMVLYADYGRATEAVHAYLERADLTAGQRNAGLEVLATAQLATRDETGADETLARLFRRDPGHRLSDPDASPVVQSAFARAREAAEPLTLELRGEHLGTREQDESPVISAAVAEGADAVEEIRLRYRYGGETQYATVLAGLDPAGEASARVPPKPGTRGTYEVEYYLEALAPSGAVLATSGTAQRPQRFAVTGQPLVGDASDVDGAENEEAGILGRWWFWTAVGVVVAGGVATYVLLGPPSEGPPDGSLGNVSLGLRW